VPAMIVEEPLSQPVFTFEFLKQKLNLVLISFLSHLMPNLQKRRWNFANTAPYKLAMMTHKQIHIGTSKHTKHVFGEVLARVGIN